jgi:hypothetical protein
MRAIDRFFDNIELFKIMKSEDFDEVDSLKLIDDDGVLCLIGEDHIDYQEEHESSFDNSRGEI